MSLLICKFASAQSRPEKIRRWIAYLDDIQKRAQTHSGDLDVVNRLRSEARQWLHRS